MTTFERLSQLAAKIDGGSTLTTAERAEFDLLEAFQTDVGATIANIRQKILGHTQTLAQAFSVGDKEAFTVALGRYDTEAIETLTIARLQAAEGEQSLAEQFNLAGSGK